MDEIDTSATTLQGYYDGMDGPSERCDNKLIETSLRSMIANPFQYLWTHGRDKRGVGRSMLCVLEFSTLFFPYNSFVDIEGIASSPCVEFKPFSSNSWRRCNHTISFEL
jgi:hypothetical protein